MHLGGEGMTTDVAGPPSPLLAGRYQVGSMLGKGGMAKVYAAKDVRLRRTVAVKIFRPEADAADRFARRRFHEEARLLANLNHPNLVTVYDAGTDGARAFLVMALVNGPSLRGVLGRGPLPPAITTRLGAQLAATLAYVHSRGVLHRDVKPSNVLLGERGKPYLTDFGLARLIGVDGFTRSGEMVGTAAYLSPEQVRGDHVGPVADVYSLGLVLLECLTGKMEYRGTEMESAIARLSRQPKIPADTPPPLGDIIAAMTSRNPISRPSAATCADWLKKLADGVPLDPPPPSRSGSSPAQARPGGSPPTDIITPGKPPIGTPNAAPLGPPPGSPLGPPSGAPPGPPNGGGATGMPYGPPNGYPQLPENDWTTQLSTSGRRGCRGWLGAFAGIGIAAIATGIALIASFDDPQADRPNVYINPPDVIITVPAEPDPGFPVTGTPQPNGATAGDAPRRSVFQGYQLTAAMGYEAPHGASATPLHPTSPSAAKQGATSDSAGNAAAAPDGGVAPDARSGAAAGQESQKRASGGKPDGGNARDR
jgi:serine/threonine protein kinase